MIRLTLAALVLSLAVSCTKEPMPPHKEQPGSRSIRRGDLVPLTDPSGLPPHAEVGALLDRLPDGSFYSYCTATLIGVDTILTAGHCVLSSSKTMYFSTVFPNIGLDSYPAKVIDVEVHPGYVEPGALEYKEAFHDLAVMKLEGFNAPAQAVIARNAVLTSGTEFNIVGYGRDYDETSGRKRQGTSRYTGKLHNMLQGERGEREQIVCPGDSGGPAFVTLNGTKTLVGVASSITTLGGCFGSIRSSHVDVSTDAEWILATQYMFAHTHPSLRAADKQLALYRDPAGFQENTIFPLSKWLKGKKGTYSDRYRVPGDRAVIEILTGASSVMKVGEYASDLLNVVYQNPQILADSSYISDPLILDSKYRLYKPTSGYTPNVYGKQEKWLKSSLDGSYFVIYPAVIVGPDGSRFSFLRKWNSSYGRAVENGELVGLLPERYLTSPELLHETLPSNLRTVDRLYGLYRTGNDFYNYKGLGEKWLMGHDENWYYIVPSGQLFLQTKYGIEKVADLSLRSVGELPSLSEILNDTSLLSEAATITVTASGYSGLDKHYGFYVKVAGSYAESYCVGTRAGSKWVLGAQNEWYLLVKEADKTRIVRWSPKTGTACGGGTVAYVGLEVFTDPKTLINAFVP